MMDATNLYAYMYVLCVEQLGGLAAFNQVVDEHEAKQEAEAMVNSPDRFAPDKQLPPKEAEQLKAAMALGGMAQPRKR